VLCVVCTSRQHAECLCSCARTLCASNFKNLLLLPLLLFLPLPLLPFLPAALRRCVGPPDVAAAVHWLRAAAQAGNVRSNTQQKHTLQATHRKPHTSHHTPSMRSAHT
jgi:hypothetical protein